MITEIKKATWAVDNKTCFMIENAEVVAVDEVRKGVSAKTGQEWKLQNINIKLSLGDEVRPDYMRLTIPARVLDEMSKSLYEPLRTGMVIDALVSFDITGTRYLQTDVRVLSLIQK